MRIWIFYNNFILIFYCETILSAVKMDFQHKSFLNTSLIFSFSWLFSLVCLFVLIPFLITIPVSFLLVMVMALDLILSCLIVHHLLRVCCYPCYPRFHQVSSSSLILPVLPLLFSHPSPPLFSHPSPPSSSFALASSLPYAFSCLSFFHVMSQMKMLHDIQILLDNDKEQNNDTAISIELTK